MAPPRITAAFEAWRLERGARKALLRERQRLARAGAHAFEALRLQAPSETLAPEPRACCARLAALDRDGVALETALGDSLARDRADYAHAADLARWIVIARGLCERAVLRDRRKRAMRARPELEAELGRLAVDGADEELHELVPPPLVLEIQADRAQARDARERARALLAPYDGKLAPDWMATAARELGELGRTLADNLRRKIVQRPPAIAGLIAGWWIAHAFTDSWLEGQLHALGLGGKSYLAPATKERLAFWLPLVAAALCTYAGSRIGARVQRRYAPDGAARAPSTATEPPPSD